MKKLRFFALFSVLLMLLYSSIVASTETEGVNLFNVKQANEVLTQAKANFSINSSKANDAPDILKNMEALLDGGEECVTQSLDELKEINQMLKSSKEHVGDNMGGDDYRYLQSKKKTYENQLSICRFYVYRTKEDLVRYKEKIQQFNQDSLLKLSTPIWSLRETSIISSYKKINVSLIKETSGITSVGPVSLVVIACLLLLAFASFLYLHAKANKRFAASKVVIGTAVTVIFSLMAGSYIAVVNTWAGGLPSIGKMCYVFALYVVLCAVANYLILSNKSKQWAIDLPVALKRRLNLGVFALLSWVFIGYALKAIFVNQNMDLQFFELVRTIYITILSLIVIALLSCVYSIVYAKKQKLAIIYTIRLVMVTVLVALVLLEWVGYHQFAIYCIAGIILTGLLMLAVAVAFRGVRYFSRCLDNANFHLSRKFRQILGLKFHKKIPEIAVIDCLLYFIVSVYAVIALMMIWRVSGNYVDDFISIIMDGFSIADLRIVPARIVLGLACFAAIILCGRLAATLVAKKGKFDGEEDTQVAISSIIFYATVAIALLIMLLIIGVNFTGLAIIAGALSVGIGLGLQTIVNNFVSGLILLLEKPIKPGDRIIVDGSEGFVKKIRIRSTQIATLAKEDVIVPNADLVTKQVTNFMFRDRQWRVVCPVGVAYGSDIDLVKRVLLQVAEGHADVIQVEPNKPSVLFKNFGDSSLLFELWCIISDVNKKYVVASDLNFAIDQAFRAENITIAFPQRDVHIKNT